MPTEGHVPAGSLQSTLCIPLHQKYCRKPVCRNPEGQMLIKASEVLSDTEREKKIRVSWGFFCCFCHPTESQTWKCNIYLCSLLIRVVLSSFWLQGNWPISCERTIIALKKKCFWAWILCSTFYLFQILQLRKLFQQPSIPLIWGALSSSLLPAAFAGVCLLQWGGSWAWQGKSWVHSASEGVMVWV